MKLRRSSNAKLQMEQALSWSACTNSSRWNDQNQRKERSRSRRGNTNRTRQLTLNQQRCHRHPFQRGWTFASCHETHISKATALICRTRPAAPSLRQATLMRELRCWCVLALSRGNLLDLHAWVSIVNTLSMRTTHSTQFSEKPQTIVLNKKIDLGCYCLSNPTSVSAITRKFKQYTLNDYRRQQSAACVQLGKLGPDLEDEELGEKVMSFLISTTVKAR